MPIRSACWLLLGLLAAQAFASPATDKVLDNIRLPPGFQLPF